MSWKKKIICALLLFTVLVACSSESVGENKTESSTAFNPACIERISNATITLYGTFVLYQDTETGVQYYVVESSSTGLSITPRYNADGTLYVGNMGEVE